MWQNDIIFATVVTDALMWPGTFFGLTHGTCRVVELSHLGVCRSEERRVGKECLE